MNDKTPPPFSIEMDASIVRTSLRGPMTIAEVADLYREWLRTDSHALDLVVELSASERFDSAALQLLLSATRSFRTVSLQGSNPAWEHALERYGLTADDFSTPSNRFS